MPDANRPRNPFQRAIPVALVLYGAGLAIAAIASGKVAGVALAVLGGLGLGIGAATAVVARGHARVRGASPRPTRFIVLGIALCLLGLIALVAGAVRLGSG